MNDIVSVPEVLAGLVAGILVVCFVLILVQQAKQLRSAQRQVLDLAQALETLSTHVKALSSKVACVDVLDERMRRHKEAIEVLTAERSR